MKTPICATAPSRIDHREVIERCCDEGSKLEIVLNDQSNTFGWLNFSRDLTIQAIDRHTDLSFENTRYNYKPWLDSSFLLKSAKEKTIFIDKLAGIKIDTLHLFAA